MSDSISKYIGTILVSIVVAGVISSVTLWGQVQVLQHAQDSLQIKVIDKVLVDEKVNDLKDDVSELKADIRSIREAQELSDIESAKRSVKLDLILEQLKK